MSVEAPPSFAVPAVVSAPIDGKSDARTEKPKPREWAAHMWSGCDFFAWMRLLFHNRFAVHPAYWHVAVLITFVSFFHTFLGIVQEIIYGRAIRRSPIPHPPIFILGHWRTGTTLLHEMLILDERHTYPTSYECFAPHHFILSERWLTRWFRFLIPSRRPMDNMAAGFDRPQEDEFALCMLGVPSPYWAFAFPRHLPQNAEYFDLTGLSRRALDAWRRYFVGFLQCLNFKDPKRLVLKSPPHTCRIPVLLNLFPDALFVHIVRNPQVVIPSTVHLWKSLSRTQELQHSQFTGLEETVLQTFDHLYRRFEETRDGIDPRRFYEVRYEDLIADPIGEMRKLYEHLGLGGFERFRPALERYWAAQTDYKTNRYQVSEEQRANIARRCADVIERYGYEKVSG